MDMQFFGANCIVLSSKHNRLIIDDNLATLGAKGVGKDGDIYLYTSDRHPMVSGKPKLVIDMPGEYEASSVSITGIQTRSHMDEENKRSAVMYKIIWGDTRVLVTGHIYPRLSDAQLEAIGIVDVMFVPVGGNGYTLDATGAIQLIKAVEPKIVIPTHYDSPSLQYEVPQATLDDALHSLGMEPKEHDTKFQFKPLETSDTTQLIVLDETK
jgi:hypothetical protein